MDQESVKQVELLERLVKGPGSWSKSVLSNVVRGITRPTPERISQLALALERPREHFDPRKRLDVVRESDLAVTPHFASTIHQLPILGERGIPGHPDFDPVRSFVDVGPQFNQSGLRAWVNEDQDCSTLVRQGDTLVVRPHTVLREGLIFICRIKGTQDFLIKTVAAQADGRLEIRTLSGAECPFTIKEVDVLGFLIGIQSWNGLLQIGPYYEGLTTQLLRKELADRLG